MFFGWPAWVKDVQSDGLEHSDQRFGPILAPWLGRGGKRALGLCTMGVSRVTTDALR